ncbi:hypothetical protein KM043_017685 [Ampulex compressa]|nr:hypothetical protein KM043_017685 [Ampulex compressa]
MIVGLPEQGPRVLRSPINLMSDIVPISMSENKDVPSSSEHRLEMNSIKELSVLVVDLRARLTSLERREKDVEMEIERRVEARYNQLARQIEHNMQNIKKALIEYVNGCVEEERTTSRQEFQDLVRSNVEKINDKVGRLKTQIQGNSGQNGDQGQRELAESLKTNQVTDENEPQISFNERRARNARFDSVEWGLASHIRPTLPTFQAASDERPQKFLKDFRRHLEISGAGNLELKCFAAQALKGVAHDWWDLVQDEIETWSQFTDRFLSRFWNSNVPRKVSETLNSGFFQGGEGQTRVAYATKLITLARDLIPKRSDEEIVLTLSRHFSVNIADAIVGQNVCTVEGLLILLDRYDNGGKVNQPFSSYDRNRDRSYGGPTGEKSSQLMQNSRSKGNDRRSDEATYRNRSWGGREVDDRKIRTLNIKDDSGNTEKDELDEQGNGSGFLREVEQ